MHRRLNNAQPEPNAQPDAPHAQHQDPGVIELVFFPGTTTHHDAVPIDNIPAQLDPTVTVPFLIPTISDLFQAVIRGDVENVNYMLNLLPTLLNSVDGRQDSALHLAVCYGMLYDPALPPRYNEIAAPKNYIETVQLLLHKGIDTSLRNIDGLTALDIALRAKNITPYGESILSILHNTPTAPMNFTTTVNFTTSRINQV